MENANIFSPALEGFCSVLTNVNFDEKGSWTGVLGYSRYTSGHIVTNKALVWLNKFYKSDGLAAEELVLIDATTCDLYENNNFGTPSFSKVTWPDSGVEWATGKKHDSVVIGDNVVIVDGDGVGVRYPLRSDTTYAAVLYQLGIRVKPTEPSVYLNVSVVADKFTVNQPYWYVIVYVNDRGFTSNRSISAGFTCPEEILAVADASGFSVGDTLYGVTSTKTAEVTFVSDDGASIHTLGIKDSTGAFTDGEDIKVPDSGGSVISTAVGTNSTKIEVQIQDISVSSEDSCEAEGHAIVFGDHTNINTVSVDSGHDIKTGDKIWAPGGSNKSWAATITEAASIFLIFDGEPQNFNDNDDIYAGSRKFVHRGDGQYGPFYHYATIRKGATTYGDAGGGALDEDLIAYETEHDAPEEGQSVVCFANDVLWMAKRDKVIFSRAGDDWEAFPEDNQFSAEFNTGGAIMALIPFNNAVLVVGEREVIRVVGNTPESVARTKIPGLPGCVSKESVMIGDGFVGWYAGLENGLIAYDGTRVHYLTKGVLDDTIADIANESDIVCEYANRKVYLSYTDDSGNTDKNTYTLVLDLYHSDFQSRRFAWYKLGFGFRSIGYRNGAGDNDQVIVGSIFSSGNLTVASHIYEIEKRDTFLFYILDYTRAVKTLPNECGFPLHRKLFHGCVLSLADIDTTDALKIAVTVHVDGVEIMTVTSTITGSPYTQKEQYFSFMDSSNQLPTGRNIEIEIEMTEAVFGDTLDARATIRRVGIHFKSIPWDIP